MQSIGVFTTHLFILAAISVYKIAAFTDEELEKIINTAVNSNDGNNKEYGQYRSIDDFRNFKSNLDTLNSMNTNEPGLLGALSSEIGEEPVRKRPFCNGFTGCGRLHGKRSKSSLLEKLALSNSDSIPHAVPVVAKRPFCNGFFGCGNPGKRIVFRNANLVHHTQLNNPERRVSGKRFFCNQGAFGCMNQGKRESSSNWFDHLRSKLEGSSSGMPPL